MVQIIISSKNSPSFRSSPHLETICSTDLTIIQRAFLARPTISLWAASVSAFPFFQMLSLLPPLHTLTSMTLVVPLAEWALTGTPRSLDRRSLSLVAGPPYPHAPQYSISIDDINKIISYSTLIQIKLQNNITLLNNSCFRPGNVQI